MIMKRIEMALHFLCTRGGDWIGVSVEEFFIQSIVFHHGIAPAYLSEVCFYNSLQLFVNAFCMIFDSSGNCMGLFE